MSGLHVWAAPASLPSLTHAALQVFRCELCDKQYNLVAEYNVHLSSYDHNHKKVRHLLARIGTSPPHAVLRHSV